MGELQAKQTTELSNDLNVITAEINAYKQVAGEAIFEIGRRLKEVRDNPEKYGLKGYRDWERWCEDKCGFTRRYANQFIKVYEELGKTSSPRGEHWLPCTLRNRHATARTDLFKHTNSLGRRRPDYRLEKSSS